MNTEIQTKQILDNNEFTLKLTTQQESLKLTLLIKLSKKKTEIYMITMNSISCIEKLGQQFDDISTFRQYIEDTDNIEVNIESKSIRVIQRSKKRKTIIEEIVTLPLSYINTIEKSQEELISQIKQRCDEKNSLNGNQIKEYFQKIVFCMNQFYVDRKVQKEQKIQLQQQIKSMRSQFREFKCQLQEKSLEKEKVSISQREQLLRLIQQTSQKNENNLEKIKTDFELKMNQNQKSNQVQFVNVKYQIQKIQRQVNNIQDSKLQKLKFESFYNENTLVIKDLELKIRDITTNQVQFKKQFLILKEQMQQIQKSIQNNINEIKNLNDCKNIIQNMINEEHKKNIKMIEEFKNILEKDMNIISLRGIQCQKKIDVVADHYCKQQNKKVAQIEKIAQKACLLHWIDPQCQNFTNLSIVGNNIVAKDWAHIFGKSKVQNKYCFSVIFRKFNDFVGLGIVDSQLKKQFKGNNKVYYQSNGNYYDAAKWEYAQGAGFKVDQIVKVTIDIKQGHIQWQVDSQKRHQARVPKLKDPKISWVPYIFLFNKDQAVQIYES